MRKWVLWPEWGFSHLLRVTNGETEVGFQCRCKMIHLLIQRRLETWVKRIFGLDVSDIFLCRRCDILSGEDVSWRWRRSRCSFTKSVLAAAYALRSLTFMFLPIIWGTKMFHPICQYSDSCIYALRWWIFNLQNFSHFEQKYVFLPIKVDPQNLASLPPWRPPKETSPCLNQHNSFIRYYRAIEVRYFSLFLVV